MMWMSQGASSVGLIGLPSSGPSARAAPATRRSEPTPSRSLRVDMLHLPFGVARRAGDAVEVLAREGEPRRRLRGLAAMGDDLGARRLHVAALVPGAALQHRGPAVPAPRHAEARERPRQHRLLQRRLAPALASVRRAHDTGGAAAARLGAAR